MNIYSSLWIRGILWLSFLGPLFFITYNFTLNHALHQYGTPEISFHWESHIPFVSWMIIPYWSLDFLYALSFFWCRSLQEINRLASRLLLAQCLSILFFLFFPLHNSLIRPHMTGPLSEGYHLLMQFDLPYNQAPALHISLLVIIWSQISYRSMGWRLTLIHGYALLIGASVLMTYQHHAIDVFTGLFLGALCLWAFPYIQKSPFQGWSVTHNPLRVKLFLAYLLTSIGFLFFSTYGGWALWALWGSLSFLLVALSYLGFGAYGFQKNSAPFIMGILFFPFWIFVWINSHIWTIRQPPYRHIINQIWVGRYPFQPPPFQLIIDLTAELPRIDSFRFLRYHQPNTTIITIPCLDLIPLSSQQMHTAVHHLMAAQGTPVFICCALGFSRSASVIIAWMVQTHQADTIDDAMVIFQSKTHHGMQHPIYLSSQHIQTITEYLSTHNNPHCFYRHNIV